MYGNLYVDCFDQLNTYWEIALSSFSVLKKKQRISLLKVSHKNAGTIPNVFF